MLRRDLLILTGAGFVGNAYAQVRDINDAINKAGRQRMLSQRMAKFFYSASLSIQTDFAKKEIQAARTEFIAATQTLLDESKILSLWFKGSGFSLMLHFSVWTKYVLMTDSCRMCLLPAKLSSARWTK